MKLDTASEVNHDLAFSKLPVVRNSDAAFNQTRMVFSDDNGNGSSRHVKVLIDQVYAVLSDVPEEHLPRFYLIGVLGTWDWGPVYVDGHFYYR